MNHPALPHRLLPFLLAPLLLGCTEANNAGPTDTATGEMTAPEIVAPEATTPESTPTPATSAPAATLQAKVVQRFPHDPNAFTQGLEWVDGRLLESTGVVGESGVRWVTPETGEVLQQAPTPDAAAFGEGVNEMDGSLYHLTWQAGEAYRLTPALAVTDTYQYEGEGWGITDDGNRLIMSDGTPTLTFRDPLTFDILGTLEVTDGGLPVRNLNELEYAKGAIWANVWQSDRIARIDPVSGQVTGWLDAGNLAREAIAEAKAQGQSVSADNVTNGIAYNAATGHFYLTGKRWPLLFEVEVSEAE